MTDQPAEGVPGPASWQRELSQAITDPVELCRMLELDPRLALGAGAAAGQFRLLVPRGFVRRMRRGDPDDPLLRQVLPVAPELQPRPGFDADPLQERQALRAAGLLHKYHGRALLITTGACAVHCRYCFRREYPYAADHTTGPGVDADADADAAAAADGNVAAGAEAGGCADATLPRTRFQAALDIIAADRSIEEVILSGGDPLSLTTARLAQLSNALRAIAHVQRLRLHTRTPIVLPERVDSALTDWIAALPWPCVIVLHCNHANEIDVQVRDACARLRAAGATLLNQSVLLAGVNDSVAALQSLSEALWSAGVLPYYLHLLDRVRGTAHFEVPEPRARRLAGELAARLPGYLVPRLARELPGARAKTVIAPAAWPAL